MSLAKNKRQAKKSVNQYAIYTNARATFSNMPPSAFDDGISEKTKRLKKTAYTHRKNLLNGGAKFSSRRKKNSFAMKINFVREENFTIFAEKIIV